MNVISTITNKNININKLSVLLISNNVYVYICTVEEFYYSVLFSAWYVLREKFSKDVKLCRHQKYKATQRSCNLL